MLNTKTLKIIILLFALSLPVIFTNSCYQDDGDAVVTIHLERNDLAAMGIKYKEGIIDKILNFFSTRAEAAPTWNSTKSNLTLTVSSDSFDTKIFTVPSTATSFTTSLPPSTNVTFVITSETDWGGAGVNIQKNWGGLIATKLSIGYNDITLQMLPMTYISSITPPSTVTIFWSTTSIHSSVQSYKIYRSTSLDGNYSYLSSTTSSSIGDFIGAGVFYYKVSAVCNLGDGVLREGVLSDAKTWL